MNISTAELHVRAIVDDTLTAETAAMLVDNETWLDEETNKVIREVSDAQGENVDDLDAQRRGLDRYADALRADLKQKFPKNLKR